MNNEMRMRKRRMLESLEYLDDDLISGVLRKIKPEREYADPVRTWSTPLKHWKSIAVLAACTVLLAFAAPTASFISQVISNYSSVAGGNAGAGTAESEVIDTGFDQYLEAFADMTEDEIYAEVLKGGWVVIGEDNSDFAAGKELWLAFFEKSQKEEPAYALIADYARINDQKSEIVLYEIIFDGDLFYYKRMYKNQIVSDEYKYLIHGIATKSTMRLADEAYLLTNIESMTLDDFNENMFSSSKISPPTVAVISFRK